MLSRRAKPPRDYVLYLLKRRLYSEVELRDRLKRRGVPAPEIDDLISELSRVGLVNDERFARLFVQEKTSLNPMGRQRLFFELIRRGIAKELAKETVDEVDEEELLEALRERVKARAKRLTGDESKKKEQLLRYLAGRGVGYGRAKELIDEVLAIS